MLLGLSKIELGIAVLLLIYILGNFETPFVVMQTFKSPVSAIVMLFFLGILFVYGNVIVLLLYVFSLYELMRRSDKEKFESELSFREEYDDEIEQMLGDDNIEGFENGDDTFSIIDEFENEADREDGLENFQNREYPVLSLSQPSNPLPEDGNYSGDGEYEEEMNPAMLKQMVEQAQQQDTNNAMNDAEVIEEFTSLLGKDSLETRLIDKMSPVGTGSVIKYKSTPYKPLGTNLTGASLI